MKKITLILLTALLLSFTTNPAETKYSVSYSINDWQSKMNLIEYTKNVLKNSAVPANIVLPLNDSLTKFQTELATQINSQMKVDSTKKK